MSEDVSLEARKAKARLWFEALQDRIIAALEAIEAEAPGPFASVDALPGQFAKKPWPRTDADGAPGGGGILAMLQGRVFEKAGVHTSTVFGRFEAEFAKQIPGADADPRFWASAFRSSCTLAIRMCDGAHEYAVRRHQQGMVRRWRGSDTRPRSPSPSRRRGRHRLPCRHARRLRGPCGRLWALQSMVRRVFFPKTPRRAARHRRYFFRLSGQRRGGGGFEANFAFTRAVGEAFLTIYPEIVRRNFATPWAVADRQEQMVRRADTSSSICSTTVARSLAQNRRQCRIDPFLVAAYRRMAIKGCVRCAP